MKKFLLGFSLVLFTVFGIQAQERTVSGKVTSADDGSALPGVNVVLKGTTSGTVTDVDGNYRLTVPSEGGILVFSFIGLETQEIDIGSRSVIDIQMASDVRQLTEVVVVGYGTQSKRNLTGSISSINSEDVKNVSVNSFENLLQGRSAGVVVNSSSGLAGAPVNVRVRGASSINASSQPLYVIDGVPQNLTGTVGFGLGGPGTSPLVNINPQDIESIEILKDASAAAIYGARAANGVVLITTKRGKAGKTVINANYFGGVTDPTDEFDMLNGDQFAELFNEAVVNAGFPSVFQVPTTNVESTDWIGAVTRQGFVQEFNADVSGGTANTQFFIGGSYRDAEHYIKGRLFERFSARLNINHQATEKLNVGLKLNPSRSVNTRAAQDNAVNAPITYGALYFPNVARFDANGDFNTSSAPNPFGQFNGTPEINLWETLNIQTTQQLIGNAEINYDIIPNLTVRSSFGFNHFAQEDFQRNGQRTTDGFPTGFGAVNNRNVLDWVFDNTVTYSTTLNEEHDITALIGASFNRFENNTSQVFGDTFASDLLLTLASAANITGGTGTGTSAAFVGYFTRINYAFRNKFLFQFSGRYDGSSRFGEGNRWGFFPAVSAGWILSEEAFLSGVSAISFAKLRASWGQTGNAEIGNFPAVGLAGFGNDYNSQPGFQITQLGNSKLQWETTSTLDVALEFGLLNNRISGSVGYFKKTTSDLLLNKPLPLESGFTSITENIGELENSGIEAEVSANILTGDVNWTLGVNFASLTNEVTKLNDADGDGVGDDIVSGQSLVREGEPLGAFYIVSYAGVNEATGNALYWNTDGNENLDGTFTSAFTNSNRIVAGDPFPDFFGGINSNLTFKGLDFSFFLQYNVGNDIYREEARFTETNQGSIFNQVTSQLARWQNPGDKTPVPQARLFGGNGNGHSTRYLEDGSFLRLKTITLGYTLPTTLIPDAKIRIYAQGQNLFTVTGYNGLDPEVSRSAGTTFRLGRTFFSPAQQRVITLGVNLTL